ncbi:hypothetical protein [Pantoea stewartii]|uniref:hypothetical protein n=1 Tax=Pantoea stewartii TaxID=66269 RepID=UPI000737437C|nr:hypothetical protein [Pantoea stewartii]
MDKEVLYINQEDTEERIERATLLYSYAKEQYDQYLDRLHLLEEKGLKVFGSISVIFTVLVLIARFGANLILTAIKTHTCMGVAACVFGALTFIGICSCWSFVFRAVVLINKPKMPVEGIQSVFFNNTRDDALYSISSLYIEAAKKIEDIHDDKALLIGKSFSEMQFTGWCFIIFVIIIAYIKMG